MAKDEVKPPAPVAKKPPTEMELLRAKLVDPEQQVKIIFVDSDGSEYPGRMLPVPLNKGTRVDVPLVVNYANEINKIGELPREKQVAAIAELNENVKKSSPAIIIKNRTIDLFEHKGVLMWVTHDANGKNIPCADLMINVSKKENNEEWKHRSRVIPAEYVGVAPKGQKGRQHFRFA